MKQALLLAFTFLFILSVTGPASAYCIYNKLNNVYSFSGEHCERCFKGMIDAGSKKCCPGDKPGCKGDTKISVYAHITKSEAGGIILNAILTGNVTDPSIYEYLCQTPVAAHGWVEISTKHNSLWCDVFNKDGSVRSSGGMKTIYQ
ncbi:MAG: hypothetical protein EPN25_12025 [Nitrospirae bacterium]|nr:MAG: hypothetical protein EPN25_12025 [Nitrospirota bacterium]